MAFALALAVLRGPVLDAGAAEGLRVAWTNNMLAITSPDLPGGRVDTWYLEAFCRSGSTHRDWHQTVIPHRTELVRADRDGRRLRLRTTVEPSVVIEHDIRARADEVEFRLDVRNTGTAFVDVQWFQPCMRVDRFTGLGQSNYTDRSFIFTRDGMRMLSHTRRTEEAIYRGGQVYVPSGVSTNDVNPRPLSPDVPVNHLIGCVSADGRWLLATAWDSTQELFQGVIVCLHADPRLGGLEPGARKKLRGKVYFLPNEPGTLLERYRRDFGGRRR
jgi:hypothetical protein